jgi:alpha-mannosidase
LEEAAEQILQLIQDERVQNIEITVLDQAQTTLELLATRVPAQGYRTYWLYPRGLPEAKCHKTALSASLHIDEKSLANEYYRIEVNMQDGTFSVEDKESGKVYPGLHRILDEGDVGDTYNFSPVEGGQVTTPNQPVKTEIVEQGPVRVRLRIRSKWALPAACSVNRKERSARLTICPITTDIELVPGERIVHIHTSIENNVKDHRLRVLFPIPGEMERVSVEGTFEICERPLWMETSEQAQEWYETPVESFPQKRFLSHSDGEHGLRIFNRGLPEAEILKGDGESGEGAIAALTLIRGVEWLSRGDLTTRRGHAGPQKQTPEAQVQGTVSAEYALVTHRGTWSSEQAWVFRQAQNYQARSRNQAVITNLHAGALTDQQSLVQVEPASIVVSATKVASDGGKVVLRVYNPLAEQIDARIQLQGRYTRVERANLLEEAQGEIEHFEESQEVRTVTLQLGANEIQTLLFE